MSVLGMNTHVDSIAGSHFIKERAERELALQNMALGEQAVNRIDRNSSTWKAIKQYIKEQVATDYMPTLRNRGIDHDGTQYARGGIDALDGLLQFGGEEV